MVQMSFIFSNDYHFYQVGNLLTLLNVLLYVKIFIFQTKTKMLYFFQL